MAWVGAVHYRKAEQSHTGSMRQNGGFVQPPSMDMLKHSI